MFDLLLSTLEVKVFHWKEFFKTNIDIVIIFFVIIAIPFIKHHMDQVHNLICDFITQLHNQLDVHSIWKKNILMKTSPIPIKCLFFLLKVPCPKLIHNAFQSVGVSVFATGSYVIMFIGFWQHLVMFKLSGSGLLWFLWPCLNIHNVTPEPCVDTLCSHWIVSTHNVTPKLCMDLLLGSL